MMYKAIASSPNSRSLLLLLCLSLAGCSGGGSKNNTRYYLIDPVTPGMADIDTEQKLAIEIIDLNIPQYLQRFQLVTRDGDNRLRLSDANQWGDNLRKNLLRTLASYLGSRLSTIEIGSPLNRSVTLPDYRIHVHIDKFERDSDGHVQLSARWQLSDKEEQGLAMHHAALQGDYTIAAGDYDQVVADMQTLFAELCDQIASSIRALEANN